MYSTKSCTFAIYSINYTYCVLTREDVICFVTFSLGETLIVISFNGQHLLRLLFTKPLSQSCIRHSSPNKILLGILPIVIELFPSVPLRTVEDVETYSR